MVFPKRVVKSFTFIVFNLFFKSHLERQDSRRINKKILVQINSGIGDSILALPMIHALSVDGFEVYALVNRLTAAVAYFCPDIKDYFIIEYKIFNLAHVIKSIYKLERLKFNYYIGALPSNLIRYAFLPIILRIPIRIKHNTPHKEEYRNYDLLFNKRAGIDSSMNNALSNLSLLSLIDVPVIKKLRKSVRLPGRTLDRVANILKNLGYVNNKITIGIHPGCKETWAFKRWPAENFAHLINQLNKKRNVQILVFGGPEEKNLASRIIGSVSCMPINVTGKFTLDGTICAIHFCQMFISNDSGLMHIATLFNIPIIALFGGRSNELATGPYGSQHIVIKKKKIEHITVDEVHDVATKLLHNIHPTLEDNMQR
ncbi:MAG: glycosyltransferase family 9 protein [bacterium]